MKLVEKQMLVSDLIERHGLTVNRKELLAYTQGAGLDHPNWLLNNKSLRAGRGAYNLEGAYLLVFKTAYVAPTQAVEA